MKLTHIGPWGHVITISTLGDATSFSRSTVVIVFEIWACRQLPVKPSGLGLPISKIRSFRVIPITYQMWSCDLIFKVTRGHWILADKIPRKPSGLGSPNLCIGVFRALSTNLRNFLGRNLIFMVMRGHRRLVDTIPRKILNAGRPLVYVEIVSNVWSSFYCAYYSRGGISDKRFW